MILANYLVRNIFSYTVTVSLVFLFVIVSSRSIQYLEQAASGEIDVSMAMWLVIYRLPEFIQLILPFGFFMSIILFFGKLYSDNEMVIINQSGFGHKELSKLLLGVAFLVSAVVAMLSFWITPSLSLKADEYKLERTFYEEFNSIEPKKFYFFKKGGVFFAEEKKEGVFYDVFLHSSDQLLFSETLLLAKTSFLEKKGNVLNFVQGSAYSRSSKDSQIKLLFDKFIMNDFDDKKDDPIDNSVINKLGMSDLSQDLKWKISLPLFTLITSFMALSLSRVGPRQGRYQKVLPSLAIFIIYLSFLVLGKTWFENNEIQDYLGLFSIHLVFFLLGFYLSKREARI